ncbi:hypothetical protein CLTEP_27530 [Clostridium tepidiprofundi DSM 19306]|uniref:Uncharacterized protein n=1 Tax=Clostridium tepidiprofundi DSM 19306 TaxID=1121338 RepID=A0A151AMA2_9CLOT|nr:hypothetical protein [Clostridium tepidiprofundi]KYH28751.1 hypothetical protein CLTEP_27530 [Clostridium tepidiprofundi DSM 19306]
MLPKLYLEINNKESIKNMLEDYCDFILCSPSNNTEEYGFYAKEKLTILATDGSGGVYSVIKDMNEEKSPIVYVSSEGQAGKIANSFNELLSLIIYYPFWLDILKFSGNGDINRMMEVIPSLEKERIEYIPNYIKIQKEIGDSLGIIKSEKSIEDLREFVLEKPSFTVYSTEDNNPSETLVGL